MTCSDDGAEKFILGPAEVEGSDVSTASANLATNNQGASTGGWVVNLQFNGDGRKKFADVTRRLYSEQGDLNRFAIVLDGLSVSAPDHRTQSSRTARRRSPATSRRTRPATSPTC